MNLGYGIAVASLLPRLLNGEAHGFLSTTSPMFNAQTARMVPAVLGIH
jgi:hypothetical protein